MKKFRTLVAVVAIICFVNVFFTLVVPVFRAGEDGLSWTSHLFNALAWLAVGIFLLAYWKKTEPQHSSEHTSRRTPDRDKGKEHHHHHHHHHHRTDDDASGHDYATFHEAATQESESMKEKKEKEKEKEESTADLSTQQ